MVFHFYQLICQKILDLDLELESEEMEKINIIHLQENKTTNKSILKVCFGIIQHFLAFTFIY